MTPCRGAAISCGCRLIGIRKTADNDRLARLVEPADPVANRSYVALGLDIPVSAITDLVTLTGVWDAGARFARLNLNTDRVGLSFGLIQWAKPK